MARFPVDTGQLPGPRETIVKIAFIGARGIVARYSGIETYYEEVGSRLVELGHEVTVYCRSYFTPKMTHHRGIRVRRFPTVRSKHLETIIHSLISTVDATLGDYDIVQFHALGSAPLSLVPQVLGEKTVVSVRGLDGRRAKWGAVARHYLTICEWASVRAPSMTTVVSQQLHQYFLDRYEAVTTYIPNGVNLQPSSPAREIVKFGLREKNFILYVGRLTPEKDCLTLIKAFDKLDTPLKLVFAGGSTYAEEYVEKLKRHQSERILFLGFQTGKVLEELFSNAYLFVLPSRIEGLSIALLEAMGYGNCVLTSDIPENVELVKGCGFTFHTSDVAALKHMLSHLIEHPGLVEASGKRCKALIERDYTWDKIALKTDAVLRGLLNGKLGMGRV